MPLNAHKCLKYLSYFIFLPILQFLFYLILNFFSFIKPSSLSLLWFILVSCQTLFYSSFSSLPPSLHMHSLNSHFSSIFLAKSKEIRVKNHPKLLNNIPNSILSSVFLIYVGFAYSRLRQVVIREGEGEEMF